LVSWFLGKSVKLLPPDALIFSSKCVWRLGSARTRWGSLSASPDPLATKRGPTSKGGTGGKGAREWREEEGKGGEEKGEWRGGKGGREGREEEERGRKGGRKGAS